jgi:hypothetical protein
MIATTKLRFVERIIPDADVEAGYKIKVLQQWWEDKTMALCVYRVDVNGIPLPPLPMGEWRDIPLEIE